MKKITLGALLSLGITSPAFAFFCPTNLQMIEFGDSIDHVQQQCGKPASTQKLKVSQDATAQEWVYNKNNVSQAQAQGMSQTYNPQQLKIMFANKHVTSITLNGFPTDNSNGNCNPDITINSLIDDVKAACGKPDMVTLDNSASNNESNQLSQNPSDEKDLTKGTVELTYDSSPPVTLVFQDGKLTEKK
ncbi:MAG: DUF2845 domain-containing protein [Gammaproteobacteria bacterium]|nr:DUF2845 domain-containing protein [Gammaproteobacteria bacterium]